MRHIQNYCIFRNLSTIVNLDIFRHIRILLRHIQLYCGIQIFSIFRVLLCLGPEVYSEPCLFRYIQAYSIIVVKLTLLTFFFQINLTYSGISIKRHLHKTDSMTRNGLLCFCGQTTLEEISIKRTSL